MLKDTIEQQKHQIDLLRLQVIEFKKLIFGAKQEKFIASSPSNLVQGVLFADEKLAELVAENVTVVKEHTKTKTSVRINHPGRNPLSPHLRRERIELPPTEDVTGLVAVGEEITEVLAFKPGELYVKQYVRPEYIKPTADGMNAKRVIAPAPPTLFPKSFVDASLMAYIIISKFIDHIPVYRLVKMLRRQHVIIDESTINNWLKQAWHLLAPFYEMLAKKVEVANYLMVDETTLSVLDKTKKGTTHTGYIWAYCNPQSGELLFKYHTGRGGEWPKEMLKNYQGYLQTDGYSGYDQFDKVANVVRLNCWAHVRRKFFDAQTFDKQKAGEVLTEIQALYAIERVCREDNFTPNEVKAHRQAHAVPILEKLHQILITQLANTIPNSPLGKAIAYTLKRWDKLQVYVQEGYLHIDTNVIENAIRPIALGRKNYLFAGNHEAAQRIAMFYTLVANCHLNGVNPQQWLTYVFENINDCKINAIQELLPQKYAAILNK